MTHQNLVSPEQWQRARKELLAEEKAMTRALDALAAKRRELPWVAVDKDYRFNGPNGQLSMEELFEGRSQLLVYHFMFGPDWQEGCPSCSYWADNYNGTSVHLAQRDTTLVAVSNSSMDNIRAYRERMGWQFQWVSSLGSDFNRDFHVSFSQQEVDSGVMEYNFSSGRNPGREMPGLSVFIRDESGQIAHSYSCYSRGLDIFNSAYQLLDLTPKGRDEDDLPYPAAWLRRHDQYGN